ncbi:unnamed protein product [Ilex paraguariensis]|uniref:IBH1-like N-terminal domain-containing protein n=1 Tax=Ilex paraguariensis TaxID=185542 RepID=A0ABC8R1G6_9AQUA
MHSLSLLKQEFLKKWIIGLQIYKASKEDMSLLERKKAIKLSANLAMASTQNLRTHWSRTLIADASKEDNNKILVEHILGSDSKTLKKISTSLTYNKRVRSKKILKRSCSLHRRKKIAPQGVMASSIAKTLVKKRTQLLRSLVPGGEFIDEFSLIRETLDYILSLRVQVDVMRQVTKATEHLNRNKVVNN